VDAGLRKDPAPYLWRLERCLSASVPRGAAAEDRLVDGVPWPREHGLPDAYAFRPLLPAGQVEEAVPLWGGNIACDVGDLVKAAMLG